MSAVVVSGLALTVTGWAQQDPLLGRWEGTVEGPQGKRPEVLSFAKDSAGSYTGTITGTRGELPLRDIKVTGGNVSAEARVETAQGSLRIQFSFVVQGGELKGKSETDFGGQTFTADYELKRAGAGGAEAPAASAPQATRAGRQSPPQPTQKQSLDYFSGRWNYRWVGRESALTPGGVSEGTLVFKPLSESAYLEGRLEGKSKWGPLGEKLLIGFEESNKALVLLEQRGNGIQTLSLGDWTSPIAIRFKVAPFQAGGRSLRLKRTLAVVAAHSFTLTEELSEDGGPFVRLGNAVFSRPAETAESAAKN